MKLSSRTGGVLIVLAGATTTALASAISTPSRCEKPYVRTEWRRLDGHVQDQYIKAVKCLQQKPGTVPIANVKSRFEDFVAKHQFDSPLVHFNAVFYPFHRLLLAEWEKALWDCGWDRRYGQPYWDWTLDSHSREAFLASPIFDKTRGFGSNGAFIPGNRTHPELPGFDGSGMPVDLLDRSGGGCLEDGPFAGLSTLLGPLNKTDGTTPNCIRRDFAYDTLGELATPARIQVAMAAPNFYTFCNISDTLTGFHPAGHWSVGGLYGTMTDTFVSPADPLFYLHHSNVDRTWWSWQQRDPAKFEHDLSAPLVPFDYENLQGGNGTVDTIVWISLPTRVEYKAGELLSIRKGPFCYTYDKQY